MKTWIRRFCTGAMALTLTLGSYSLMAQDTPPGGGNGGGGGGGGRRNFDPEQMRQRMMERYREQLEIKDDAEWKLISERIEKVSEARREVGGGFGMGRPPGGRRGGDGAAPAGGDDNARRQFRGFGEPSPEQEALQKAIESKASADEIKAKLAAVREARKKKEAALEKAQEELKKVLTAKQEAVAVLNGLLK